MFIRQLPTLTPNSNSFPRLPTQRLRRAEAIWTPATPVTSPPRATRWSTRLTRTVTGSSQPPSLRNASSSTSTRTLRSRSWTAGKKKGGLGVVGVKPSSLERCEASKQPHGSHREGWSFKVSVSVRLPRACEFFRGGELKPTLLLFVWLYPSHNNHNGTSLCPLSLIIRV